MFHFIKNTSQAIIDLFYPNICNGCHLELVGNESLICTSCLHILPKAKFHLLINNPVEQKLTGRIEFNNATSMYYFNKGGTIQHIMHALKYKGHTDIGVLLGQLFAKEISSFSWVKDIDIILPIPLSKQKLHKRGYNQCDFIAAGMNDILNITIDTQSVIRKKNTQTQTQMNRLERMKNMEDAFEVVNIPALENKHVLILDDVITSGATIESFALALQSIKGIRLSIATLCYATE